MDRVTSECAELFAEVIMQDTGLPRAEAELLAVALAGMAQVSARYWLHSDRRVPREAVDRLMRSCPGVVSGASRRTAWPAGPIPARSVSLTLGPGHKVGPHT